MKKNIIIKIFVGCMALGGALCNFQPLQTTGGTGSEFIGVVFYPKDSIPGPVANARVYVFDEMYLADTSSSFQSQWAVVTDKNGAFRVGGLTSGTYVIEIVDSAGRSIATRAVLPERQAVYLDTLFVTPPGTVQMPIMFNSPRNVKAQWYVRVYGTRLIARGPVDSSGMLIGNLPTGIPLSINLLIPGSVPIDLDFNGISVAPDSTRILPTLPLNSPLLK